MLARPEIVAIDLQVKALALDHLRLKAIVAVANDDVWTYLSGGLAQLARVGVKAMCGIGVKAVTDKLPFGLDALGSLANAPRHLAEVAESQGREVPCHQ